MLKLYWWLICILFWLSTASGQYLSSSTVAAASYAVESAAIIELVGVNEQIDAGDYGGSIVLAFGAEISGYIVKLCFLSTEDGTAPNIIKPAGTLLFFSADPVNIAGDGNPLDASEWATFVGQVNVAATDWYSAAEDANSAVLCVNTSVAFAAITNLYLVWSHIDGVSFNDVIAYDHQFEVVVSYQRES